MQIFNYSMFCEHILPLVELTGIESDKAATLFIAGEELLTTARAVDGPVKLTYEPESNLLHMVSGNFDRPLVTHSASRFVALTEARIGTIDPASRQTFSPWLMKCAIEYVLPAIKPDMIREQFTVLTLESGTLTGGTELATAIATVPRLAAMNLSIRLPLARSLKSGLAYLADPAELFETPRYYLIRDAHTVFGFEKTHHRFPLANAKLNDEEPPRRIIVGRSSLINALKILLHGSDTNEIELRCKTGDNTRIDLTASTKSGKKMKCRLEAHRPGTEEDIRARFSAASLLAAAESGAATAPAPNICLDFYSAALIVDESSKDNKDFEPRTIIVLRGNETGKRMVTDTQGDANDDA